jgi:hypothetical protein
MATPVIKSWLKGPGFSKLDDAEFGCDGYGRSEVECPYCGKRLGYDSVASGVTVPYLKVYEYYSCSRHWRFVAVEYTGQD